MRTRDFFVVTRSVGEKVPLLRDAVGGFCLLIDLAGPGVVVHTQPDVAHAIVVVFDSRGYYAVRALSGDYVARLRPIVMREQTHPPYT